MEHGVERLDARNRNVALFGKFQRRAEKRLYFHWRLPLEIPVHDAMVGLGLRHLLHRRFPEIGGEFASLGMGDSEQLVDCARHKRAYTDLFEKFDMVGGFKKDAGWMESNGPCHRISTNRPTCGTGDSPNHTLELLLANVLRHLAVHLASAKSHGEGLGHVCLDLYGNGLVGVGGTNPDFGRTLVLKLARSKLQDLCS